MVCVTLNQCFIFFITSLPSPACGRQNFVTVYSPRSDGEGKGRVAALNVGRAATGEIKGVTVLKVCCNLPVLATKNLSGHSRQRDLL